MNADEFKQEFLQRLGSQLPFEQLVDLLPDVGFFVKDRAGHFVMLNRRTCEYCRVDSERACIGKTDYDFFPKDRADMYANGDRQVMESGEAIINAIAPAPEEEGSDRLIIYSKVPLKDRRGKVIGVAGIYREVDGLRAHPKSYGRLSKAVQHIHTNYAESINSGKLATMVGISRSQFDRRFHQLFGTTPSLYLLRVRVNAACRLLTETDRSVTDVALDVGFYDHSHFSRTFTRLMGISPLKYRKRHMPG